MARAIGLVPLALLTACAHAHLEPGPAGLAYLCRGEPLTIVYGDGGYISGSTVRSADGAVARSRAQLTFRGRHVDLVADDAFTDLRYTGTADPVTWTAQGETAQLSEGDAAPVDCERVRTVTPVAPTGAEPPHPAA